MADIEKLLRKRKPSGAELGLLEIANFAHQWKHHGEPDVKPLYNEAKFQKMLDRISGTEDERIYMAYISIHKWLVNIGGVATAHGITLDSSISMLNSMIAEAVAHEAVYSYISSLPAIMTPAQYQMEKENGFAGNQRALKNGVAVLAYANERNITSPDGVYIPPEIGDQGVTALEILAGDGELKAGRSDSVDECLLRISDSYHFLIGYNLIVDMIVKLLDLPDVAAFKVDTEQYVLRAGLFNEEASLLRGLIQRNKYDDEELKRRKLEAMDDYFSPIHLENITVPEAYKEEAWEEIRHFRGFTKNRLLDIVCHDRREEG